MSRIGLVRLALVAGSLLHLSGGPADSSRAALPHSSPAFVRPAGALLADDFSHGLTIWEADREGVWSVVRGMLRADLPDAKQERSFLYAGSEDWKNYTVDLDVCGMRGVDKGVVVRVMNGSGLGVDLRGPGYHDVLLHRREWPMGKSPAINGNGVWHHLRVEAVGAQVRVIVNGELKIERGDPRNSRPRGRIALAAYTGGVGECTVFYDNVVVTPLP
ncbi:MAG: family 16 glycoside hydrolase [Candidatus Eisenbacteria bacterium]